MQNFTTQIGLKKILWLQKLKTLNHGNMYIEDLYGEEILERIYEKELQYTNQRKFRIEKVIKKKGDKLCFKWKSMIIHSKKYCHIK